MKIKNHYNHWLPKLLDVGGVTLRNHIFYYYTERETPAWLRRHEEKHVEQYKKYTTIGFLLIYTYHYLKGRLQGWDHQRAYEYIPFEIEARKAERRET